MSKKATAYPDNWLEKKLGDICLIEIGGTPSRNNPNFWAENEEGYPWVAISDLGSKWVYHTAEQITRSGVTSSNVKLVPKGTVLMSFKLTLGRVGVAGVDLYSNEAIAAFFPRSSDVFSGWLYHTLPSIAQSGSAEQAIKGQTLNKDKLERLCFRLPPLPEQRRIAEILDTMDEAIARTESLIAKLKQMKAGLLHDLLTRGLDENGELRDAIAHPEQFKDSPLGRTPKDWSVVSVGECLVRIEQGWSPDCESTSTPFGEWGVLKTTAVVWDGYQDAENKRLPGHLQPDSNYEVKPGDVLMTRAGPNSRVGVVALVRQTQGKLMLSDKLYRLVPYDSIKADFLAYTLSGSRTQNHLSTLKTGLAESQTNISQEIVRTLLIDLPSTEEQQRIITVLEAHNTRIYTEEAYRDKLKLQKKGLMHDLLTGKVRVNGAELAKEDTSQLAALTTA